MKKALLMKTNALEPNRQDEKVSAGSTRADLLLQVCKQVKEQVSEESWKLTGNAEAQGKGQGNRYSLPGVLLRNYKEKQKR